MSTSVSTATGAPSITIKGVEGDGKVQLTATLTSTGANGQPQADKNVDFFFNTTQFGTPARPVPLGSVTTDKTGVAKLILGGDANHLYRPTTKGPQEFGATFTPTTADAKPITSTTTVTITVARSAYTPRHHPSPGRPGQRPGRRPLHHRGRHLAHPHRPDMARPPRPPGRSGTGNQHRIPREPDRGGRRSLNKTRRPGTAAGEDRW